MSDSILQMQCRRVYEILRLRVTDLSNPEEYKSYRLEVKKRLNIPFQVLIETSWEKIKPSCWFLISVGHQANWLAVKTILASWFAQWKNFCSKEFQMSCMQFGLLNWSNRMFTCKPTKFTELSKQSHTFDPFVHFLLLSLLCTVVTYSVIAELGSYSLPVSNSGRGKGRDEDEM